MYSGMLSSMTDLRDLGRLKKDPEDIFSSLGVEDGVDDCDVTDLFGAGFSFSMFSWKYFIFII